MKGGQIHFREKQVTSDFLLLISKVTRYFVDFENMFVYEIVLFVYHFIGWNVTIDQVSIFYVFMYFILVDGVIWEAATLWSAL